jgi:hypothetical protein
LSRGRLTGTLALAWPLLSAFTTPELTGTAQVTVRPPAGECCAFSGAPASLWFLTSRSIFAPNGVRLVAGLRAPERAHAATLILDLDLTSLAPQGSRTLSFPTTRNAAFGFVEEEMGVAVFYCGTAYGQGVLTAALQRDGGHLVGGRADLTCVGADGHPGSLREVWVSFSFVVPPHESWEYAGAIGVSADSSGCGGDLELGEDTGQGCGGGEGDAFDEGGSRGDDSDGSRTDCSGGEDSSGFSDCGGPGASGGSDSHCSLVALRDEAHGPGGPCLRAPCRKRKPRTPLRMAPYLFVLVGIALLRRRVRGALRG